MTRHEGPDHGDTAVASKGAALAGLVLVAAVGALVTYKASAALGVVGVADAHQTLAPRPEWLRSAGLPGVLRPLVLAANYLETVWVALAFGVVIGAAVKALVPGRWLDGAIAGGARGHLAGGLLGSPLMLCSCCAAPVFDGVYSRTRRLGPALALMLAAPSLNPFALLLTAMLFPPYIAVARAVLAVLLVLGGSAFVARVDDNLSPARCGAMAASEPGPPMARFLAALGTSAVTTLPVIVLGVLASALLVHALPIQSLGTTGSLVTTAVVALLVVPLALPTFAEIPLGLGLLAAGAPEGAVLALLVAGPAVNLPSLLTLRRTASTRAALAAALVVGAVALLGGVALDLAAGG